MGELFQGTNLVGMTVLNALSVWPLWRILRRAGLAPAWALAVFVPVIGQAVIFGKLAHSRWPVLPEKVRAVRKERRTV